MRKLTPQEHAAVLTSIAREITQDISGAQWQPRSPRQTHDADWGDKLRAELETATETETEPAGYCEHFDCACSPEVIAGGLR